MLYDQRRARTFDDADQCSRQLLVSSGVSCITHGLTQKAIKSTNINHKTGISAQLQEHRRTGNKPRRKNTLLSRLYLKSTGNNCVCSNNKYIIVVTTRVAANNTDNIHNSAICSQLLPNLAITNSLLFPIQQQNGWQCSLICSTSSRRAMITSRQTLFIFISRCEHPRFR